MNKIINGRKYDTNTAKKICETTGFDNKNITLYQKKNGEFFFCHWHTVNEYFIDPTTEEEAKDWVAYNMDADFYESIFGPVEE